MEKSSETTTKLIDEKLSKLMFIDERGRLYRPLMRATLLGKERLFVSYITEQRNGYIDLDVSRNHRCLGNHNNLRLLN